MKHALSVLSAALIGALFGCGSNSSNSSDVLGNDVAPGGCTPGEALSCGCPDGTTSAQTCNADGASLSPCACGTAASESSPSGPAGTGATGSVPPSTVDPNLGTGGTGSGDQGTGGTGDPAAAAAGGMASGGADPVGAGGATDPATPNDPNAPIVEVSGVACGSPLDSVKYQPPIAEITGRQVFIDYPCGKPQGTPVTFILNLHGTMDQEDGKIYIRSYLPAYQYDDQYDFIIATPKAITSQWGNNDGGQDLPHLLETIDWMYTSFAGFDIQQMWIVGHSWGAMYARDFACRDDLADKVAGVVLMSGGSTAPSCADRLSILGTVGETDIVPGEVDQAAAAAAHGCGGAETYMVGNNNVTNWPNCEPQWVHRNYFMLGKGHGFDPADWPETVMIDDMVDAIYSTR